MRGDESAPEDVAVYRRVAVSLSAESDEDLVRRARAGDAGAATALFDRHLPLLRVAAKSRLPASLRGKVGESDVVQEAYLAAFVRLGEFEDRGDGSFRAWLRQILAHKIVDEVRRHVEAGSRDVRREVPAGTSGEAIVGAVDRPSPSMEVAAAEEIAALRMAVEKLPSAYAEIVRLVHQEDLTLVEAGTRMGRSAEAARKLYGRALARLAGEIEDPGDDT
jgi:RNA polymerase sigma-70 factor (ECF subfamily)